MQVIHARNVNHALPEGLRLLRHKSQYRDSRAGKVHVAYTPVTTIFYNPKERVLFNEERDANPFFHLYESLWMLSGAQDVDSVAWFVKRMKEFSDDGETLHGAYGNRWRYHFGFPQLGVISDELTENPNSRRCVLSMWDPASDLGQKGKDLPCNTHVYFSMSSEGELEVTVCCRSNDMIWGAYGANVVHFSMLQEYMAARIGCKVGIYHHFSNNFHVYENVAVDLWHLADHAPTGFPGIRGMVDDPYSYRRNQALVKPLVDLQIPEWMYTLDIFIDWVRHYQQGEASEHPNFDSEFLQTVAVPMVVAYAHHKNRDYDAAQEVLHNPDNIDWLIAAREWMCRRRRYYEIASADGVNYEE